MAAALAAVAGASNVLASLGSTAIQSGTSIALQQNEQSYNQNVMSRAEDAFTSAGLPKFLAYSGGNSESTHLPGQQFQLRGSNFYSAGLVGQNVPFLSTPYQAFTHTGRPTAAISNPNTELSGNNEMGVRNGSYTGQTGLADPNWRPGFGYPNFVRGGTNFPGGVNNTMINRPMGTYFNPTVYASHQAAARMLQ